MRILRVIVALVLLHTQAFAAGSSTPPGLRPANNLSDLTSNANGRVSTYPVTQRDPLPTDYLGYSVGSLWHGTSGWWVASRQTASTSQTLWTRLPSQQNIAGTALAVYGTQALYTNSSGVSYTGNLFTLTRMSDLTTQTFAAVKAGLPDTAAMALFCASTICRYTEFYDQSGNGNHGTQTSGFSWAPRYGGTIAAPNGAPGAVLDYALQSTLAVSVYPAGYALPVSAYTTSPNTVTLSQTPLYPIQPGWQITGTNIPTATAITGAISGGTTFTTSAVTGTLAAGQTLIGAAPGTTLVSLTSGSGNAQVWTITPSQTNAATAFKAETLVTAVNAAGTQLTLSSPPTGTANVSVAASQVGIDLPSSLAITAANAQAAFMAMKPATLAAATTILTVGATAQTAPNATISTTLAFQNRPYASPYGMVFSPSTAGGNSCAAGISGFYAGGKIQVIGFNRGANYYNWYDDTYVGTRNPTGCQATGGTTAGSIGYTNQWFGAGIDPGSSFEFYGLAIYNRTLSAAEVTATQQGLTMALGLYPQVVQQIVYDGSSTTAGTGDDATNSQPNKTSQLISGYYPNVPLSSPTGGTIEVMLAQYPYSGPGYFYSAGLTPILVVHFGSGNSMQASGTVSITGGGATSTMTAVFGGATDFQQGAWVTDNNGGACLASAQILTSSLTTITLSATPTCTVSTLKALNDCGAQAWNNAVSYLQLARATGYKIVLVGSAARGTFDTAFTENCLTSTSTELYEFQTFKALEQNHWSQYADAYVDLQDDPAFGDAAAGGAMTVTAVSGNVVTVSSVSSDAAVGSYVKYIGMPDYAVKITALSGNNITLSASPPSGLAILDAINIAPWTANPAYWLQTANQHFLDIGYEAQAHLIERAVMTLLPVVGK